MGPGIVIIDTIDNVIIGNAFYSTVQSLDEATGTH